MLKKYLWRRLNQKLMNFQNIVIGEPPILIFPIHSSLYKFLCNIKQDPDLLQIEKTTLWLILKAINFSYKKVNKNSTLKGRHEILCQPRNYYIRLIRKAPNKEGKYIIYYIGIMTLTSLNMLFNVSNAFKIYVLHYYMYNLKTNQFQLGDQNYYLGIFYKGVSTKKSQSQNSSMIV